MKEVGILEELEAKGKVDPIDTYVGKKLKTRRIMLGLSQHDLGEAVNVSIQQIQKYEKATNRISSGKLYAFAKLLLVPVEFFFTDVEREIGHHVAREEKELLDSSYNIAEKELLALVRSFSEIKDVSVRKKIVDLLKSLSDKTDPNLI